MPRPMPNRLAENNNKKTNHLYTVVCCDIYTLHLATVSNSFFLIKKNEMRNAAKIRTIILIRCFVDEWKESRGQQLNHVQSIKNFRFFSKDFYRLV